MEYELRKQLRIKSMMDQTGSKNDSMLKQLNAWERVTECMSKTGYFTMDEQIGEVKVMVKDIKKRNNDDYSSSSSRSKLQTLTAMVDELNDIDTETVLSLIAIKKARKVRRTRLNKQSKKIKKERDVLDFFKE